MTSAEQAHSETSQYSHAGNRCKITFPALVFNRTPTRERVEPARAQTPIISSKRNFSDFRAHSPQNNPLRASKNFEIENLAGSRRASNLRASKAFDLESLAGSRCKENGGDSLNARRCINHPQKSAKYKMLEEQMLYCEKCAILLASQGFKVSKIDKEPENVKAHHHRRTEIAGLSTLAD